jgi:hypothetical protein
MSKDPAFLFYHQDFFTGVSDMTNEEVGAYIKCLCIQASKNGISEKHMSIICQSNDIHNLIKSKFILNIETNLLENSRLKTEIDKRKKYSESRSNNRKKGIKSKITDIKSETSYDEHMEDENVNENIIDIKDDNLFKLTPKFNFRKKLLDYGFHEKLVNDWILIRKNKKATDTETIFNKFIKEIEKATEDKNIILEFIIGKDWKSFEYQWLLNPQSDFKKINPEPKKTRNRP